MITLCLMGAQAAHCSNFSCQGQRSKVKVKVKVNCSTNCNTLPYKSASKCDCTSFQLISHFLTKNTKTGLKVKVRGKISHSTSPAC